MEEITRYQQLRQPQKISDEEKLFIGLQLYPDNKLSGFAAGLRNPANSNDTYASVIHKFKEGNNAQNVITDLKKINPIFLSLYDWFNFKSRPINVSDLKKFVNTLDPKDKPDLEKEWISYADNLLLSIYNKNISINHCIDFQLLIRICYIIKLCLIINNKKVALIDNLSPTLLNEILTRAILLPPGVIHSRCVDDCSQKRPIEIPTAPIIKAISERDCKFPEDVRCQPPSRHCICIRTYVGDLFVIKESLARYEAGDIADIENILAGETKVRRHRKLTRTEETSESERQTDTSEERDHQVNERFTLQAEVKNMVDSKIGVDAGVTATIKYGDTATITPHANVTANFSKSESESIARSYAKELIDRSVTKIQEKVRTLQVSKAINELEERNKHSIDNTDAGAVDRAGIYFWVNKITHAQVFNYGKHMMFDVIVSEPAATFKKLYQLKIKKASDDKKAEKPDVTPDMIKRGTYGGLLNKYAISSTEELAPPGETTAVQIAFGQSLTEPEKASTATGFAPIEIKSPQIPDGYRAVTMDYDIQCYTAHPLATQFQKQHEVAVSVSVGNTTVLNKTFSEFNPVNPDVIPPGAQVQNQSWRAKANLPMNKEEGIVTVGVAGFSTIAIALSGTVSIKCELKPDIFEQWQTKIYNLIMTDYNRRLEASNSGDNKEDQLIQIKGRNPFLNREIERNEFKRHVIAILMCNYFNGIGSMMDSVAPYGYPEIDFQKLEKDAPIIQFFEQVFEWNYLTYLFYHSMWARKHKWPELIDEDSGDPLFDKFLMAGAARVQIPVRPGMEEYFSWFLMTGQLWGGLGRPPISGEDEYVSMIQELKESKQGDYTDRAGLVDATKGNNILKLTASEFYWDVTNNMAHLLNLKNDVDREILIDYKVYRIVEVKQDNPADHTAWNITIDRPFEGKTATNLKHAVGALFVGAPWEVLIPTKLVYLKNPNDKLPVYPLA